MDLRKATARHVWRRDGTCEIRLSFGLVANGDAKAVHRRIIIAGFEHGHNENFRAVAANMYQRERYPRGKPGDHCGNV
jgi:hypothetical protein